MPRKLPHILPILLLLALASAPALAAAADEVRPVERTITISTSGEVTATPDIVDITLGVQKDGPTAKAALDANSRAMRPIVDAVKAAGIEPKDIQTSDFSVSPNYLYNDGEPPKLIGYRVSNMVHIRVRKVEQLGDILDKVIGMGANQVNGIAFTVSNNEELRDEARKAAIARATRMAKTYAAAAGVELGEVLTISESAVAPPPRPMLYRNEMAASAAAPPPIEAGEQSLQVDVTVVWAIK